MERAGGGGTDGRDDDNAAASSGMHNKPGKQLRHCLLSFYLRGAGTVQRGVGAATVCLLVLVLLLSRDDVPIGHLDFSRAYYDRREVLYSRWVEFWPPWQSSRAPRTYAPIEKRALGLWEPFNEDLPSCPIIEDTPLVWTLKTPKAASSTLQDLIVGLAKHHPGRFVVNTRQLRVDPTVTSNPSHPDGKDDMLQRYAEYFTTLRRRTVYTAHGWFIDLERGGRGFRARPEAANAIPPVDFTGIAYRPVYIGTLRLPLPRLMSHYAYLHSSSSSPALGSSGSYSSSKGPRSAWALARHGEPGIDSKGSHSSGSGSSGSSSGSGSGSDFSSPRKGETGGKGRGAPSFADCVAQHQQALKAGLTGTKADPWKCVHWAGVQLRYFCGYSNFEECNAAGTRALAIANANIDRHFLTVALVERFDESLALLEKVLPSVFKGVVQLYAKQGSSRVNTQRTNTQVAQASPSLGSDGSSSSSSSSGGSSGGGFSAAQAPGVRGGRSLHTLPLSLSFSFPNTVLPTETTKGSARHNATAKAYLSLPPDVAFFLFNKLKHEEALYERLERRLNLQINACRHVPAPLDP